jgi:diacylglycerol kinase (ATP)
MPDGTRPRRGLLIVNEKARRGADDFDEALSVLDAGGIRLERERCSRPEDIGTAIRSYASAVDLVIVGGGDGTLNAAAPALIETDVALGILPLGTANDLARTLEIPPDLTEAAKIIADGHARRIDLGEVNGIPYFNVASLGLTTKIAQGLTQDVKRRWGTLGYVLATFRALSRMRPFRAELTIDGKSRTAHTVQIAVGNGRFYGGGLTVAERASIEDGRLDVYSLESKRLWKLALIYPAFRVGRQRQWNEVRAANCTMVEIKTRRPRPINADGEISTETPARFRVLSQAITVLVPERTA